MNTQDWNQYEDFEKIVSEKSYSELTPRELKIVSQFISGQQAYEAFRLSGSKMKNWFHENPVTNEQPESLQQLKRAFRQQQPEKVYSVRKVWVGYAMVAMSFGLLGWWLGKSEAAAVVTTVDKIMVHDTVYLAAKPDTVFREKIIYRDRSIILTTGQRPPEASASRGVSMKEKEELDKLLVSGSGQ